MNLNHKGFNFHTRAFCLLLTLLWVAAPVLAQTATPTVSSGPTASATPLSVKLQYPKMVIGPGDLLSILVLGYDHSIGGGTGGAAAAAAGAFGIASQGGANSLYNPGLPQSYLVDTDGMILFPFLGPVNLEGLTQIEASQLLMKRLKAYLKFPQVSVMIQSSNTYNVSVIGDLLHPGQFMIRGKPDVLSMIAQAGGPGPNSDLGGALLTRGTQKIHLDLGKYMNDSNYHDFAPTVYPGDVIYVPQSPWPTLSEIGVFIGIIYTVTVVANGLKK